MICRAIVVLLLAASSASAQLATAKTGGIQADLLSLGLKGGIVTASVRLTNTNKGQMAYVLAMGSPSAVDTSGVKYIGTGTAGASAVNGIAYCVGPNFNPPEPRRCIGSPKVDEYLFPIEQYTEIEPDNSVIMQVQLMADGAAGKSEKLSLSVPIVFRLVKSEDVAKDGDVPQATKLHSLRFGSLGFQPTVVNQETSSRLVP